MNEKQIAKQHCANYGKGNESGICSGFFFQRKENKELVYWIDKKHAGKECNPTKCSYYKNIVVPGLI